MTYQDKEHILHEFEKILCKGCFPFRNTILNLLRGVINLQILRDEFKNEKNNEEKGETKNYFFL